MLSRQESLCISLLATHSRIAPYRGYSLYLHFQPLITLQALFQRTKKRTQNARLAKVSVRLERKEKAQVASPHGSQDTVPSHPTLDKVETAQDQ
jgi:hypothetical protein